MARSGGFKIADAYVEIHADRDELERDLRELPRSSGAAAERAGRELGEKINSGLVRAVEANSARLARARQEETRAADAVKLAEVRLTEARETGRAKGSQLLALEQRLTQEQLRLASAHTQVERATVRHAEAERRLADSLKDVGAGIDREAQRRGDDAGGKLAQGMRLSIIRNSPLIVAAVGAALAFGAPVAIAGATALFGGIAVVAAAQRDKVQQAYSGLFDRIKKTMVADSVTIEDTLIGVSNRIGAAFTRMRPQLREAFSGIRPLIDDVADGVLGLAENALPGFLASIQRGQPVFTGLQHFLESTGTGLSDFFRILSLHSESSGRVFSQLGVAMERLLPFLAELLGRGADLAADVLPLLNSSLGVLLRVTQLLGPALPAVAKGLMAFTVAKTAAGWLQGLGTSIDNFAVRVGRAEAGSSRFANAARGIGSALPIVGVAAIGITEAFTAADRATDELTTQFGGLWDQVRQGGKVGQDARNVLNAISTDIQRMQSNGMSWAHNDVMPEAFAAAQKAAEAYRASLPPLERAQMDLKAAENDLAYAIEQHGEHSLAANEAREKYRQKSAEVQAQEDKLQRAIHGVTDAMVEQADQALAAIDKEFAYRHAVDGMEDAQNKLAEAIKNRTNADKNLRTTAEDVQRAQLDYEESVYRVARAFGEQQAAQSNLTEGTAEYQRMIQTQTLAALYKLRDTVGPGMRGAIDSMIKGIEASGVSLDELGKKKAAPKIDADKSPFDAKKAAAEKELAALNAKHPTPVADLDNRPLHAQYLTADSLARNLGAKRPTPVSNMDNRPLSGAYLTASMWLARLNGQRPTPVASLVDYTSARANAIIATLSRIQSRTVTITTNYVANYANNQVAFRQLGGATGGRVLDDSIRSVGFDIGGKVRGPGGPTEDRIRVLGPDPRLDYRLSNLEWIVQASSSQKYGDRRMQEVNDGTAVVMTRDEARSKGFAGGGRPGDVRVTPTDAGAMISIGQLHVHVQGVFDFTKPGEMRRLGYQLVEVIRGIGREQS